MAGLSGLGSWARMLYLYQPDLYRTKQNAQVWQGLAGHQFAALSQLIYAAKVRLRDGKPDLALTILPSALGEQLHAVLLMCSRRYRGFYVRHREPLLFLSWVLDVRSLVALNVHFNRQWESHGGSALRLLLLLLVSLPAFWQAFAIMTTPHVLRWTCFSLPLCATYMLTSNSAMCARILSAEGIEQPLATLHGSLTLAQ
ncbi:hypothetical protein COHA_007386 [Chlorella ohadii]|uniref:Uncharacterized protein n=1 Tax=Chlorella ohadii TaxID=2649997 RepID=A0AAD5DQU6_9CHLO|nr:hypothetical protein COHA_007386 [Chlorella ohadii]